jgi:hypothetical protein
MVLGVEIKTKTDTKSGGIALKCALLTDNGRGMPRDDIAKKTSFI